MNPKLSLAIHHESTIAALEFYTRSEGKDWGAMAAYLRLILDTWDIVDATDPSMGRRKRSLTKDVITSPDDWKLQHLRDFAAFLQQWEDSKEPGLTKVCLYLCLLY